MLHVWHQQACSSGAFLAPEATVAMGAKGRVAGGMHALLSPPTSPGSLVTGTDKARREGDIPRRGTEVGTGIFGHRRCSLPTHGTGKPCQGPDLSGKGIWVLSGQYHRGSGCQALGSWEMHVCTPGMAHGRVSPLPGAPLTPLHLRLAGILLFLSFSFQCPAVFEVKICCLGGKKKK